MTHIYSNLYSVVTSLLDQLAEGTVLENEVIPWSCPVPLFGDLSSALLATIGINPSNREFVDAGGEELTGQWQRFHTLNSLGLKSWEEADTRHLEDVLETYLHYFVWNPYHIWFDRLEHVLNGANLSYYDAQNAACHIDLVPYATYRKWGELTGRQRTILLEAAGDALGTILRDSPLKTLVLNGRSVVETFASISNWSIEAREMPDWSLPRSSSKSVPGIAYTGFTDSVSGVGLSRPIRVLGFNHNLQGSFGITTEVVSSIRSWVGQNAGGEVW